MSVFQIGQVIRSMDFRDRDDCYVEGVIVGFCKGTGAIPIDCYVIECDREIWKGKPVTRGVDCRLGRLLVPIWRYGCPVTIVQRELEVIHGGKEGKDGTSSGASPG